MQKIDVGNEVEWRWGRSKARGRVAEKFTGDVERTIKGRRIKRHADPQAPAFLIKQENGNRALKSGSELRKSHD
jgi:hypothetical protein